MTKKTKEVGRKIAKQLYEIKEQEKAIRTLEKEKDVRERQEGLKKRIRELKKQRPTIFRKVIKAGKTIGKGIGGAIEAERKRNLLARPKVVVVRKTKRRGGKSRARPKTIAPRQKDDFMDFLNKL